MRTGLPLRDGGRFRPCTWSSGGDLYSVRKAEGCSVDIKYMVDQSDVVIAVWSGRPSGTGKTVTYALNVGKPVIIIDPISFEVTYKTHKEK